MLSYRGRGIVLHQLTIKHCPTRIKMSASLRYLDKKVFILREDVIYFAMHDRQIMLPYNNQTFEFWQTLL